MKNVLKASCVAIYLLAIMVTVMPTSAQLTQVLQYAALLLLGAHMLELVVALKYIRRYPGALIDSIALTLAFGFLHWKPLMRQKSSI